MNVTENAMREYLSVFHETLDQTAKEYLPREHRNSLLHTSLLPARIIGYVSTQFGAGVEYIPFSSTDISIVRGSCRVEELFVQAPRRATTGINGLFRVQEGPGTYLSGGRVSRLTIDGFPFRLLGRNAIFRCSEVAFKIGSWVRKVKYAEIFGNRGIEFWSKEQAISRAKDEVLVVLAQLNRAQVRNLTLTDYIREFKERIVLLLGDYDERGIERLNKMAVALSSLGYDPVLIKDLPDQLEQDLVQKVSTIGYLARFVVVDDSSKSGHLTEVQLCRSNNWITVLLREGGRGGSWMTAGSSVTSNVILEREYDIVHMNEAIANAANWAEAKIVELKGKFDGIYPSRKEG